LLWYIARHRKAAWVDCVKQGSRNSDRPACARARSPLGWTPWPWSTDINGSCRSRRCQHHRMAMWACPCHVNQVACDDCARGPSIKIRSSISVRGYLVTVPAAHLQFERLIRDPAKARTVGPRAR